MLERKARGQRLYPRGYVQVTVSNTATALTLPASGGYGEIYAVMQVESNSVRYRDDGVNPTSSVGMLLLPQDRLLYDGDLVALRFIRAGSSDAVLNISYYV
jgi:hypothetical protein